MIEHRCSKREAMAVAASLHHKGRYLAAGRIRNINQSGVFVETEILLPKNTFVEVEFNLADEPARADHRFFAMVAHSNDTGMGLYVDVLVPQSRDGLDALLAHV